MKMALRWTSRHLSRLEVTFVVIVLAIIVSVFLGRALWLISLAEARSLQITVQNLNSALRARFYEMAVAGRLDEIPAWQGRNPLALLGDPGAVLQPQTIGKFPELGWINALPAVVAGSYAGEFDFFDSERVRPGQWYYDRGEALLVYRVRNTEFFRSTLAGAARIRFRLAIELDDRNGDGVYNPGMDQPRDVFLQSVDAYHWSQESNDQ